MRWSIVPLTFILAAAALATDERPAKAAFSNSGSANADAETSLSAACPFPALEPGHRLVVLRLSGGEFVSPVAVTGLDQPTEAGEIRIGAGAGKLNVVIHMTDAMVIQFTGHVERLAKVVIAAPSGAGVTGLSASKVRFRIGDRCVLPDKPSELRKLLGKTPDIAAEQSDLYRAWTDGRTFRMEQPDTNGDTAKRTHLEEKLSWLHPGGVARIVPAAVLASGEAIPYSVLPYAAGAVQLEREGALVPVTSQEVEAWKALARVQQGEGAIKTFTFSEPYRVTRPIRVPVGLCGGHSLTFFVPSGDYLSGPPCHSNVVTLDGRILAPSWYANDPHCGSAQFKAFAQPDAPGPLRFRESYCPATYTSDRPYQSLRKASPDAGHLAFLPTGFDRSQLKVQEIRTDAPAPREFGDAIMRSFRMKAFWQTDPPFEWRSDSRAIWAVRDRSEAGADWTGLEPMLVGLDGSVQLLPDFGHPAGPVEAIMWAGGEGKAIAQFRGDPLDPVTRKVLPPTFAMVDAKSGAVLESLDPPAYARLRASNPDLKEFLYPERIVAVQQTNGELHALLNFGAWVSWRQGTRPRVLPALPRASAAILSNDGKTVLLLRPNLPGEDNQELIVFCDEEGGRHGPCPKRNAKEGTWASLHDLETGAQLWGLRWTFDRHDRIGLVAASPDGRLALMSLLSRTDPGKSLIAVVSLDDGKIVQTLRMPPSLYSMGFAEGGKAVWIVTFRGTTLYSVH